MIELFETLSKVGEQASYDRLPPDQKYRRKREAVEKLFAAYPRAEDKTKSHLSPSGKYRFDVTPVETKPGCWNYAEGIVFGVPGEAIIVRHNYHDLPFAWVEGHANGHDYLVTMEDYQGYTVIELDTGERVDALPEGWCWASIHPSPDKSALAVHGCYWAAPYNSYIFDFSEPLKPLARIGEGEDFKAWTGPCQCEMGIAYEARKSDGKKLNDLTDDESDEIDRLEAAGEKPLIYIYDEMVQWSRAGITKLADGKAYP